jgi:hypothetical protein
MYMLHRKHARSFSSRAKTPKKILTYRKRHDIVGDVPHKDRYGQAKVAQLVEHSTENAGVVGSIPSLGTFYF